MLYRVVMCQNRGQFSEFREQNVSSYSNIENSVRMHTPASGDIRIRLHAWIRVIYKVGSMVRFSIVI